MVVTVIAAMSLRGYWRTLIVRIACKPAIRITKLTTNASTGRLMKRAVNDYMPIFDHYESTGFGFTCGFGARSLLIVTVIPFRSLKTPVLTTVLPAFNPSVIAQRSH